MKPYLLVVAFCLALTACGPKYIGESTVGADDAGGLSAAQDPAQSRYPMDGNRVQQRLYLLNQPGVMERMQRARREFFLRRAGIAPNDYNNLQPKQPSPFRQ